MTTTPPPAVKLADVIAALDLAQHGHPHRDDFIKVILDRYVPQMIEEIVAQRTIIMQVCEHLTAIQQQMQTWADENTGQETTP